MSDEIFISYATLDNDPSELEVQWIESFKNELQRTLQRHLGRCPRIWKDTEQIRGNDDFKDRIFGDLMEILVLLPLLSPSYFSSQWCSDEFDRFVSDARQVEPLDIKDRVFKILLQPENRISPMGLPRVLKNRRGYSFFELREPREAPGDGLNFDEIRPRDQAFLDRITDLAKDICRILERSRPSRGTVYISPPTIDLDARYLSLVREWSEMGYKIVPDPQTKLPDLQPAFEEAVGQHLSESLLSIHLLGKRSRDPDDLTTFSRQWIEYELAKQKCAGGTFQSIVWAPSDMKFDDAAQEAFVVAQVTASDLPRSVEIVRNDFRVFMDAIKQKIELLERNALAATPPPPETAAEAPTVYLVYDRSDQSNPRRREVVSFLKDNGFEVLTPSMDDEGATVADTVNEHVRNLKEASGVLVFCGNAPRAWQEAKKLEVMKNCLRKDQPACFYLGVPESDYKNLDFVAPRRASTVTQYDAFDPEALRGFAQEIVPGIAS